MLDWLAVILIGLLWWLLACSLRSYWFDMISVYSLGMSVYWENRGKVLGILVSETELVFFFLCDSETCQWHKRGESRWLRGENCQSIHWTAGVHSGILAVTPLGLLSTLIPSIKRPSLWYIKRGHIQHRHSSRNSSFFLWTMKPYSPSGTFLDPEKGWYFCLGLDFWGWLDSGILGVSPPWLGTGLTDCQTGTVGILLCARPWGGTLVLSVDDVWCWYDVYDEMI